MYRMAAFAALSFGITLVPHFVLASPAINEIIFDPAGTDTGLEKIELYNPDDAAADIAGWELYPDGIGYFVFPPGFTLRAKSFVTVHLRTGGVNGGQDFYHSTASGNMGNSSGSVALFRTGGRSKDTIADFVRYHKPSVVLPPAERKTWESAAADVGLWSVGTYVDISALSEGQTVGLIQDGVRADAKSWKVYSVVSMGGANGVAAPTSPATSSPQAGPNFPASPSEVARTPTLALGAEAGEDRLVLAGAITAFRGMAFGLDGQPLTQARFLWNFGDGAVQEGRNLTHVYNFPGTYRANLVVSSGEYIGSDWLTVKVTPAAIYISEVRPGGEGFVELYNASPQAVDIGGLNLTDEKRNIFRLPLLTFIAGETPIVFSNIITTLDPEKALTLRDARTAVLDDVSFSGVLPAGASFERKGSSFIMSFIPTPGNFRGNNFTGVETVGKSAEKVSTHQPSIASSTVKSGFSQATSGLSQRLSTAPPIIAAKINQSERDAPPGIAKQNLAGPAFAPYSRKTLVLLAFVVSLLGAVAFIALKRKVI